MNIFTSKKARALLSLAALTMAMFSWSVAQAAPADVKITEAWQNAVNVVLGPTDATQTYNARFVNTGASAETVLLDLELYDPRGRKIAQHFETRTIPAGAHADLSMNFVYKSNFLTGKYILRVGVFAPEWASLLHWRQQAVATGVTKPGQSPIIGTGDVKLVSGTVDKTTMPQCGTITATAVFETDDPALSQEVIVDFELWKIGHKAGSRVWHNVVVLGKDKPKTLTGSIVSGCNPPAMYTWKIGIFKPGWTEVIHWYDSVATFEITDPSLPQTGVRGGVLLESSSFSGNTLIANIGLSSGDFQKVLVNAEIYNAAGTKVHQEHKQNIFVDKARPRRTLTFTAPTTLPPGTYTWKVGIFEGLWQKLLHWQDSAATFTVN